MYSRVEQTTFENYLTQINLIWQEIRNFHVLSKRKVIIIGEKIKNHCYRSLTESV